MNGNGMLLPYKWNFGGGADKKLVNREVWRGQRLHGKLRESVIGWTKSGLIDTSNSYVRTLHALDATGERRSIENRLMRGHAPMDLSPRSRRNPGLLGSKMHLQRMRMSKPCIHA